MKTLEGSRYFNVLAWTLVIAFSLFTLRLTMDLKDTANTLIQVNSYNIEQ